MGEHHRADSPIGTQLRERKRTPHGSSSELPLPNSQHSYPELFGFGESPTEYRTDQCIPSGVKNQVGIKNLVGFW